MSKIKAWAYLRVSSDGQAEEGSGLMSQLHAILEMAEYKKYDLGKPTQIVLGKTRVASRERVVIDAGTSAYKLNFMEREQARYIMDRIQKGEALLAYNVLRLSRNLLDFLNTVEFLNRQGILFCLRVPDVDIDQPFGRALVSLMGVFGQLESDMKSERLIQARKARQRNGRPISTFPPVGFHWTSDNNKARMLALHREQLRHMRLATELRESGMSLEDIHIALWKKGCRDNLRTPAQRKMARIRQRKGGTDNGTSYSVHTIRRFVSVYPRMREIMQENECDIEGAAWIWHELWKRGEVEEL